MAHRGPASKGVKLGRTPGAEWTDVENTPYTGVSPDLPKLPNRRRWTDLANQWWEQVRSMPHCVLWGPTDWQFAIETAFMKEQFWRDYLEGEMKGTIATEIRRREGLIGTTAEARRQLRIRYFDRDEATAAGDAPDGPVEAGEQAGTDGGGVATVTPIADRRNRLTRSA